MFVVTYLLTWELASIFLFWNMGLYVWKSYLEKDPELVKKVRQLRLGKHTNSEISKILYNLGYKTQTGKPFGRGMITRLYQQSELLPVEEKEQILEEMRDEYRT